MDPGPKLAKENSGFFHRSSAWFVIIVLINIIFKSINVSHSSFFLDEASNMWHFQQGFSATIERSLNDPNPPIFGLIMTGWIKLFGISELATRMFSVLMSSLAAGMVFRFGQKFFSLSTGIMAALLFSISEYQLLHAHLARPYTLLTLEIILSYYLLLKYINQPSYRNWLFYFLIGLIILYTHPTGVFNLITQGIFALIIFINKRNIKFIIGVGSAIMLSIAGYFVWYSISPYFQNASVPWVNPPDWPVFLHVIKELFDGFWLILFALGALISFTYFLIRKGKSEDIHNKIILILALWLLCPVILNALFSTFGAVSIFNKPYNMTIIPAIGLLIAGLIFKLTQSKQALAWTAFIPIFLFTAWRMDYRPAMPENWDDSTSYAKSLKIENSAVIVAPFFQFKSFAYYYDRDIYQDYKNTRSRLIEEKVYAETPNVLELINRDLPETERIIVIIAAHDPFMNEHVSRLQTQYHQSNFKSFNAIKVVSFELK